MKCVFCQGSGHNGHALTCPMRIETTWSPSQALGPGTWEELARTILEAWRQDTCVYDRGSSEDVSRMEDVWTRMGAAMEQGDPTLALGILYRHYNPEGQTHTPGHGRHGA